MAFFSPPETLNEPHFHPNPRSTARFNSLAYTQSPSLAPRDSRLQPRKPTPNWLIAVVPAPSLSQEPQLHAHTLSTSPPGRFTDGILIPLFPSLYAQLAAIAREYNMPSTVGLCIYLQTPHAGIMTTPRISDESWPLLWNHLSDNDYSHTPTPGPPIAGRIEFDVDHRKGRWLDTWLGMNRKISTDFNTAIRPPWQLRDESKTDRPNSLFDVPSLDIQGEREGSPIEQVPLSRKTSPPQSRGHLRRLSLLHGADVGLPAASKPAAVNLSTIVSPNPQGDGSTLESKLDLAEKVRNWREGSIVTTFHRVEPTNGNIDNSQELAPFHSSTQRKDDTLQDDTDASFELDLKDFSWSISSLGPRSYIQSPTEPASPLLSVHLPSRLAGSVCLTPTTATSFGPDDAIYDDELLSVSRLPSPDIACRIIEDSPYTPTTATSWGVPSWADSSDSTEIETHSIDLAHRCAGSVPPTPIKETTHVDLWKLSPWGSIWPYNVARETLQKALSNPTPRLGSSSSEINSLQRSFYAEHNAAMRGMLGGHIEYSRYSGKSAALVSTEAVVNDAWKISPWGPIWPFKQQEQNQTSKWAYNHLRGTINLLGTSIYWPYNRARGGRHGDQHEAHHTTTSLDDVKTATTQPEDLPMTRSIVQRLTRGYAEYAKFLEGNFVSSVENFGLDLDAWKISPWGPIWPICPTQRLLSSWPYNPSRGAATHQTSSAEWPYYIARGALTGSRPTRGSDFAHRDDRFESRNQVLLPSFSDSSSFYDTWKVTPWGLIWPYSTPRGEREAHPSPATQEDRSIVEYPTFNLYPAVYPFFELYPIKASDSDATVFSEALSEEHYTAGITPLTVTSPSARQEFHNLFVYPDLCIYPPVSVTGNFVEGSETVPSETAYPILVLYPAIYPHFTLYPSPAGDFDEVHAAAGFHPGAAVLQNPQIEATGFKRSSRMGVNLSYPYLVIYDAIYPHFHLYPAPAASTTSEHQMKQEENQFSGVLEVESQLGYPVIAIYSAVYPHVEPYPVVLTPTSMDSTLEFTLSGDTSYDLRGYRHFYPHVEPYPKAEGVRKKTHAALHNGIFGNGYRATPSSTDAWDDKSRPCDIPFRLDSTIAWWPLSSPVVKYPVIIPYPTVANYDNHQKSTSFA